MKKVKAKLSQVVKLSGKQLQKLDAKLRARELRLRADGKQPLRRLFNAADPGVKVIDLYKF